MERIAQPVAVGAALAVIGTLGTTVVAVHEIQTTMATRESEHGVRAEAAAAVAKMREEVARITAQLERARMDLAEMRAQFREHERAREAHR